MFLDLSSPSCPCRQGTQPLILTYIQKYTLPPTRTHISMKHHHHHTVNLTDLGRCNTNIWKSNISYLVLKSPLTPPPYCLCLLSLSLFSTISPLQFSLSGAKVNQNPPALLYKEVHFLPAPTTTLRN